MPNRRDNPGCRRKKTTMIDVVLTAFSCGGSAPCGKWASELFDSPPTVVWVPGANSTQFEKIGRDSSQDIRAWAAAHARCPLGDLGRIAVVSFSAGWGFPYRLLLNPVAAESVDATIILDGIHTHDLSGFKKYAARSATNQAFLAMAHSQITPPYVPTKITNREIMSAATASNPDSCELAPEYITSVQLESPIHCGNQYGRQTYTTDPLVEQDNSGSAWRFEYQGSDAAIHIYIANYVQPRMWKLLADRWNQ